MKISKLWLDNVDKELLARTILKDGIDISNRCTGKSTGNVLSIIGAAMTNPNKPIKVSENGDWTDRHLYDMTWKLIEKLNLKYFTLRRTDMTLTYNPFVEVEVKLTLEIK